MNRLKGLNILVVDDNRLSNQTLKQLLELSGVMVTLAENGREALETLRANTTTFQVILMDIHMPEIDGIETTKIIRQDPKLASIPIVAVTADRSPEDQWKCFQAGMDAHIAKPLDYNLLVSKITDILDNKNSFKSSTVINSESNKQIEPKKIILARFANNIELVRQMIGLYEDDFRLLTTKLDLIDELPSYEGAREILHTMKGNAATIGAIDVVSKVQKLRQIVRANLLYKSEYQRAKNALLESQNEALESLKKTFKVSTTKKRHSSNFSSAGLTQNQINELKSMLEDNDLSAISHIERVKRQKPNSQLLIELSDYVNQLKFKEAIALLSAGQSDNQNEIKYAKR